MTGTPMPDSADPVAAARHFAETWRELLPDMLVDEYGCEMTCSEAEAAAGLYRALGDENTAAAIIAAHGRHDEEGEQHYQGGSTGA